MKPATAENERKRPRIGDSGRNKSESRYHSSSELDERHPNKKRRGSDIDDSRKRNYEDDDTGEIKEDSYKSKRRPYYGEGEHTRSRKRDFYDDHRSGYDRTRESGSRGGNYTSIRERDNFRDRERDRDWDRDRGIAGRATRGYAREDHRDRDKVSKRSADVEDRHSTRSPWRGRSRARGTDEEAHYSHARDNSRHDFNDDFARRERTTYGRRAGERDSEEIESDTREKERRQERGGHRSNEGDVESWDRGRGSWKDSGGSEDEENDRDVRARRRRELERLRKMADDEGEAGVEKSHDARTGRISSEYLERLRQITESQRRQREDSGEEKTTKPEVPAPADEEAMDISDHSDNDEEGGMEAVPVSVDEESALMQEVMGFKSFETSKGKKHQVLNDGSVSKKTKRKYRQYMNRKGGFNRPLSPVF